MNMHRIAGIVLVTAALALVGCGGGGGGGGGNSNNNTGNQNQQPGGEDNQQAQTPVDETPAEENPGDENTGDDDMANHGNPDQEQPGEGIDPELLLPVEEVAQLPGTNPLDPQDDPYSPANPGTIAANPEPTTLALGAMGLAWLASRRLGRQGRDA